MEVGLVGLLCSLSKPDCSCCCLSNKYTYMQLRSPEVTRVNFHLTYSSEANSSEWEAASELTSNPLFIQVVLRSVRGTREPSPDQDLLRALRVSILGP